MITLILPPAHAQGGIGVSLSVAECIQYQYLKNTRGQNNSFFRRHGFKPMRTTGERYADIDSRLWTYRVRTDTLVGGNKPFYRRFVRNDILGFAVIDKNEKKSACQYVFWWKGYYRRFANDLRRMGFLMSNSPSETNVLIFKNPDIDITVKFIIWEDIYVMEID